MLLLCVYNFPLCLGTRRGYSLRLEQEKSDVPDVEVDEMLRFYQLSARE